VLVEEENVWDGCLIVWVSAVEWFVFFHAVVYWFMVAAKRRDRSGRRGQVMSLSSKKANEVQFFSI
jgi:hypothetical protein